MEVIRVTAQNLYNAASVMMQAHFDEVNFDKTVAHSPDMKLYQQVEDMGLLLCLALVDGDILLGYLVAICSPMQQNAGEYMSRTEAFYVRPEYRKAGGFNMLLEYYINFCKKAGIAEIGVTTNENFKVASDIMEAKGFSLSERVYIVK